MNGEKIESRYSVRDDGLGGYGVWNNYLRAWVVSDLGDIGLLEGDAESLVIELGGLV